MTFANKIYVPAGSFRWERFVKSSLASSIAGFMSGGREASLPFCRASSEISADFTCVDSRGLSALLCFADFLTKGWHIRAAAVTRRPTESDVLGYSPRRSRA